MCTDQGKGFADSDDKVTWDLPTENVRKVDLIFRDVATSEYSNFFSGQAKVRDLKIFYVDSPTSEGKYTFRVTPLGERYGESSVCDQNLSLGEKPKFTNSFSHLVKIKNFLK